MLHRRGIGILALAALAGAGVVWLVAGHQPFAQGDAFTEQDLREHLSQVAVRQAEGRPVGQVRAFRTAVAPYHSAQFNGYEVVLSAFSEAVCNQIMKSPWVEDWAAAKSLTTQCGDPGAEIRLLRPTP